MTVVIVGFLMMATGAFASELYERWVGEEHTQNTIANLEAIDTGITKLKTDLEKKEQDLLAKQAELDTANANLKNSITLEELETLISATNIENGPSKKYDSLKDGINKHLDDKNLTEVERLKEHNGKEIENNQLNEALKDVKQLEEKSGEILESLNTDTE